MSVIEERVEVYFNSDQFFCNSKTAQKNRLLLIKIIKYNDNIIIIAIKRYLVLSLLVLCMFLLFQSLLC